MSKQFLLGDKIVLTMDAHHPNGSVIPEGTVGTVCGLARWLPQIDFGPLGIKAVAPHALRSWTCPTEHRCPTMASRSACGICWSTR